MQKSKLSCRFATFYKRKNGFTIIEALVVLFIFSLITVTFYSLFSVGTKYIIESKNRLKAIAVANEKMEIVRSLNYDQIGIIDDGYIDGDIPGFEQIILSDRTFYIFSSVVYFDNAFDGKEGEIDDDDRPNDYKKVTITVAWENDENTNKAVTLVSDFAPPGVEEAIGGGTLLVKVLNKNSEGIENVRVHIENDDLDIVQNLETDSNGGASLPGLPADGNDYEISISKTNYFSIGTLPPYPTSIFYPVYAHASVTEGVRNIYTITTDLVSDLTLKTQDALDNSIQNVGYNLKGGIKKGDTIPQQEDEDSIIPSVPIPFYDENLNSGSNGENEINDISYGDYLFSHTDSSSDYEFIKMFPYDATLEDKAKFSVDPGTSLEEKAIFANKNINSLLVTVVDNLSLAPIRNAEVRLYNLSLPSPYDTTLNTDDFGLAYFPCKENSLSELSLGEYNLEIKAETYQDKSDTVAVNKYVKKEIKIDQE